MADVVVDAKPMSKLPYDPKDIPPAVRKRAAAVDALYSSTALTPPNVNGKESDAGQQPPSAPVTPESAQTAPLTEPVPATPQVSVTSETVVPPTPTSPAPAEPSPAPTPTPAPTPVSEDENSDTWKNRAASFQGRYNAAQRQIGELQEQLMALGNELLHTQRMLNARPTPQPESAPPQPPPSYLTEQDVQNYGGDLIDFTQRAAVQAVAPHLQRLEGENVDLRQRLAREARRALDQAVEIAVPNFREIDNDPRWHRWLLGIDLYSGRVRQQLLNEAIAAASAPRVISFFKGFLQEEVATGHIEPAQSSPAASAPREPAVNLVSLAAPGRARPATGGDGSLPPEKPIYTRANLRQLYEQHRKGAFTGREAEWARIDADIIAAGREGRIQG